MKTTSRKILLVDDDQGFCLALEDHLAGRGYQVTCAHTVAEADRLIRSEGMDVALVDQQLPDGSGLDLARRVLDGDPEAKLVLVTAFGEVAWAVEAMRYGVFDYLQKPVSLKELEITIERALKTVDLERNAQLSAFVAGLASHQANFVGSSQPAQEVRDRIAAVAEAYPSPVLITGETGTGKSLAARAIHRASSVPAQRLLAINCAAIPDTMFEAELFGHERGVFTGAHETRKGMFELAHGGSLLLDEIGELPLTMQPKLLRVLDEGAVRRVGGQVERRVKLRVMATTNRDVEAQVEAGQFRADLYYRLAVARLEIPPLRERLGDLTELVALFCRQHRREHQQTIGDALLARLASYAWPGNVRELKNVIDRVFLLTNGSRQPNLEQLLTTLIPKRRPTSGSTGVTTSTNDAPLSPDQPLPTLAEVEQQHIQRALARVHGNKVQAAKLLGISRSTLRRKLAQSHPGQTNPPGNEA